MVHLTAAHKSTEVFRAFINAVDMNQPLLPPRDLHMLVAYGDLEDIEEHLTHDNVNSEGTWDWGSDMNPSPETSTLTGCACYWGRVDALRLLIKYGADVNKPDIKGRTPLHQSCVYDGPESSEMAKILLASGADVNVVDHDGFSPLAFACKMMPTTHTDEVFNVLVNAGAYVNRILAICYSNPKTWPLNKHHKYCFPPQGWEDRKGTTPQSSTPLICACNLGRVELVRVFINAGADVNQPNFDGWTPIHEACDHRGPNVFKIIKLLLERGAVLNVSDNRGVTPLHTAIANRSRRRHTIVRMLKRYGAIANYRAPSCCYLANPTANVSQYCSQGLLHFAIGSNQTAVKFIIDSGADINARCWRGRTPLFFSVQCRDLYSLRLLIKSGADLNIASYRGLTPLHEAIRLLGTCSEDESFKKLTECVTVLLESGTDLNPVDGEGLTPLQYADKHTHCSSVEYLLDHGAGSNVKCRKVSCSCNSSVTTCHYLRNKSIFELAYWKYYWKSDLAGFTLGDGFLPSSIIRTWTQSPTYRHFRDLINQFILTHFKNQLDAIKMSTIGSTAVTYYDILVQYPPAIKNPVFEDILTKDNCLREFAGYGNLIYAKYVRGVKRFKLIEQCTQFFSLLTPVMVVECATEVLGYLEEQDLLNIIDVITFETTFQERPDVN